MKPYTSLLIIRAAIPARVIRTQVVLKSQSQGLLADIPLDFRASPLNELWTEAYQADLLPNQIRTMLEQGVQHSRIISLAECTRDGN